jgi:hypothetical protein
MKLRFEYRFLLYELIFSIGLESERGVVFGPHSPFPSLLNPVPQTIWIDDSKYFQQPIDTSV